MLSPTYVWRVVINPHLRRSPFSTMLRIKWAAQVFPAPPTTAWRTGALLLQRFTVAVLNGLVGEGHPNHFAPVHLISRLNALLIGHGIRGVVLRRA